MKNRLVLTAFTAALSLLSVWFLWPIYEDVYLFIAVGAGLATGFLLAALKKWRKLSPLSTLLLALISYLLLALPATNPRALTNPGQLFSGWLEAVTGPVFSWKQLITVELPVGTYHALLSPAFLGFMVTGFVFGWVYFGSIARFWSIAYAFVALVIMGISFGTTGVPSDFNAWGLILPIPTPLASGSILLLSLVFFLNWGARAARRSRLNQEADAKSANLSGWSQRLRRNISGLLVIALAIAGTSFIMQEAGISSSRTVLRTDYDELKVIQRQASPLSSYRMYFTSEALAETPLVTYSVDEAPDRIRIATMPFFDGTSFTVAPTNASVAGDYFFARVPSDLPPTSSGRTQSVTLTVEGLKSIWIPLVAGVRKVSFEGEKALALADALFVNRETGTGAVVPGTSDGSQYTVTYNVVSQPEPESVLPSTSNISEDLIPESLKLWLDKQVDLSGADGAGITAIAKRLRERGFLSHSVEDPNKVKDAYNWVSNLGKGSFYPSTAGHNIGRIDKMFKDLNAREQAVGKTGNLVSTAGDDEQFATAIALIASYKGFPVRVVSGFRTSVADAIVGVDSCQEANNVGTCTGQNMTAWVEIRGANGDWLAIDATPQFEKKMNESVKGNSFVKNPSSSGEDKASTLPPAKATPSSNSLCEENPKAEGCEPPQICGDVFSFLGCAWNVLVPFLQAVTLVGIFVGPFALIILMKRNRRRGRKLAEFPETRVIGAWEEFIDLLVDTGSELPGSQTRLELAKLYDAENLTELATLADIAAFSPRMPTDEEIDRAWAIFEGKYSAFKNETKLLGKVKAKLSLRSFLRVLRPKDQLKRIRTTLDFTQGNSSSEGSKLSALGAEAKRQVIALFSKKKKPGKESL